MILKTYPIKQPVSAASLSKGVYSLFPSDRTKAEKSGKEEEFKKPDNGSIIKKKQSRKGQ